ncbi:MAG: Pr6Pr family membrane protein [Anaerolineae bacterium]|jgi:hypothetical protein|nr:Pr6Pr family membrane protein [Anaerolineae bacterium]
MVTDTDSSPSRPLVPILRALLGTALILYLLLEIRLPNDLVYYTYQTNLLCGAWWLAAGLFPRSKLAGKAFQGSVATYITITALVYNTVLMQMEIQYRGYIAFSSILTHMVVPGLMLLDYLAVGKTGKLRWQILFPWMGYPMAYLGQVLILGAVTGRYPYPIIDPAATASSAVLIFNYAILFLLHIAVAAGMVGYTRVRGDRGRTIPA